MACFKHSKRPNAIRRGPRKVLLKVEPTDGDLDGIDVYIWAKSTCDCNVSKTCPTFKYEIDLKKEEAFLSEGICRTENGKRESLYVATVQRRRLGAPTPIGG